MIYTDFTLKSLPLESDPNDSGHGVIVVDFREDTFYSFQVKIRFETIIEFKAECDKASSVVVRRKYPHTLF